MGFLWWTHDAISEDDSPLSQRFGGRVGLLVFVAMFVHSIPEGIAIGVGYGIEQHTTNMPGLGRWLTVVIAAHNVPEGLAVALPMRAGEVRPATCFVAAFLTSLPQPVAAVPASLAVGWFAPLVLPSLGFAAGAMLALACGDLLPDAIRRCNRDDLAAWFTSGIAIIAAPAALL